MKKIIGDGLFFINGEDIKKWISYFTKTFVTMEGGSHMDKFVVVNKIDKTRELR